MSPEALAAAARERLDAAIAAGRLTPRPSPATIVLVADLMNSEGTTKPQGETG
jgi:hypothetical protein